MLSEFEANGYTFDYGLDAEPYDLRPIGEYGEGGGLMSKEIDDDTWNRLKREAKERMSKPENVDLGDDLDMET